METHCTAAREAGGRAENRGIASVVVVVISFHGMAAPGEVGVDGVVNGIQKMNGSGFDRF